MLARLYHGTSERHLATVLKDGVRPRGKARGNWQHTILSNRNAVYLTIAYPLHYALAASRGNERLAVLEINVHRLNPFAFTPDEDFLEQATRTDPEFAHAGGTMAARTKWFRRRLNDYSHHWELSLKGLGNCCYHGDIPAEAISRVALLNSGNVLLFSDPTISLLNYRLLGPYYRSLARALFGDAPEEGLTPHDLDKLAKVKDALQIEILDVAASTPPASSHGEGFAHGMRT